MIGSFARGATRGLGAFDVRAGSSGAGVVTLLERISHASTDHERLESAFL